jgi:hypothetical protein
LNTSASIRFIPNLLDNRRQYGMAALAPEQLAEKCASIKALTL